jgi:hypothetical protein
VSKTALGIVVLVAAAGLWALLRQLPGQTPDLALDLGKKYLGLATSLAGVLGIAIGGSSFVMKDTMTVDQVQSALIRTATGLGVTLAGGAMVGGDPWVPAAALVTGGLLGVGYMSKKP